MEIFDSVVFTTPWIQGAVILVMILARSSMPTILRHAAIALGQGLCFYSLYGQILASI